MSGAAAELRILTGCHAGARAAVVGGEGLGPDDSCDLLLTDLGLPGDAGAWIQIAAGRWWVRSDPLPQPSSDADAPTETAPIAAWVEEQAWGAVAYLGQVAMTVSAPDAAWQHVPVGLAPAAGASNDEEALAAVALDEFLHRPPHAHPSREKEKDNITGEGAAAQDVVARDGTAEPAPSHAVSRRWHPAWIIGVALAALLLSVLWSLLQGANDRAGGDAPALPAAGLAEAGAAQQQRLLREIQRVIAGVDPALRLRVEALPAGGARVSGWVADIAQLDRLADGLAEIRPVPALSVRTASELVDDLIDAGGPEAPALRFELMGEGRVQALGLVSAPAQRDQVLAALRARVPAGIEIVDGLRVAADQGGAVQEWLRTAGFAGARARWDGQQMVIGLDIPGRERARLETMLSRPATPLSGIPFLLHAREVGSSPVRATRVHASAAPLPFRIRSVVSGPVPYVVLSDGSKLQPGGRRAGWRLVAIETDHLVFDGPRALEVLR